jgi:hypothetical protein
LARSELLRLIILAMSNDGPIDLGIRQLPNAQFTGEGAVGSIEHVLRRDGNSGAGELAGEEQVQGWRDNNGDFGARIEVGVVESGDDGDDGIRISISSKDRGQEQSIRQRC